VLSSFAILAFAILIAMFELPPMLKKKLIKESVTFCIILSIGAVLIILISFGIQLPNPINWIITLIQPLTNLFDFLLK
jgi:uncharacterized membrane protein (DUF485 family)